MSEKSNVFKAMSEYETKMFRVDHESDIYNPEFLEFEHGADIVLLPGAYIELFDKLYIEEGGKLYCPVNSHLTVKMKTVIKSGESIMLKENEEKAI